MPRDDQDETLHLILTLMTVKMKVKFPCKMTLEHNNSPLTPQVPPNEDGKFPFNQEIRLREDSDKLLTELNVCLVTDKGARYISGIVKLYHNELMRSEGERVVVSLTKCLDSEAFCELKVDRVIREGGRKRTLTAVAERTHKTNLARLNEETLYPSNEFKPTKRFDPTPQTKSETHFPVTSSLRPRHDDQPPRAKQYPGYPQPGTSLKRPENPSPKLRGRAMNSKNKYQPMDFSNNNDYEREKVIEAEVYKDNYQKLKQKFMREAENSKNQLSKRMMLENNQNTFKLQIVRLKIRNEQLQKNISEKNSRLKELSSALAALQGREGELNMLREDVANKQHSIHIMEDTIISLSRENDELRSSNKEISYKVEEKIMILENEIDVISSRADNKQQELQRELKILSEALQQREAEIGRKNEMLEKEKRSVYELERNQQNKLFEYDALLQNEKANYRNKLEQHKLKIDEANALATKISSEKTEISAELDRLKGIILKNEYEFKLYQQEINNLKTELEDLRPSRDKYNDLLKEYRIVSEHKVILEKNNEKLLVSKENTLDELANEYKKEVDFLKRSNKDLEDKTRHLSSKLIETQGQLQVTRAGLDKSRKGQQNTNKEFAELKQKEKTLKKNLKISQQQCEDAKKQTARMKEKLHSMAESMKQELSKLREQLGKTKIQLQSQIVKNEQFVQTTSDLSMQLARLKMSLQFSDQKYEKLLHSAQQKYSQFQKIIKEHDDVIELLQQKIKSQKMNEKEYYNKLQNCEYEINLVVEKNEKVMKESKTMEERNRQLESSLKSKNGELGEVNRRVAEVEAQLNVSEETVGELKDTLQFTKNQLEKCRKIIEIVQKDHEKAKSDLASYHSKLNDRDRQLDQKTQQSRKDKQTISTLQTKFSSLKKQSDKFKDTVSQAINHSFIQFIQTFSTDRQESKVTPYGSFEYSGVSTAKRGMVDMSNDLVSAITYAGKENKSQISKLSERTRLLERDLEMARSELERTQEQSKRLINEKSVMIEQMQEELRSTKTEKGETELQSNIQICELQQQIKHYQDEYDEILNSKKELQFTIASLKVEIETITQQYQRKISQSKRQKADHEQKLEYQYHTIDLLQKKTHDLQVEIMNINSVLLIEKEASHRKDIRYAEKEEEKETVIKELESTRKLYKQSEERFTELEIQFMTIREIKEKYENMLSEEESKLKDIRVFNSSILKEKEEIIKKELERNMEIANLQHSLSQTRNSLQQEIDLKNKYKSDFEEAKEIVKRYGVQIKDLEAVVTQQKAKYSEIRDKLREKEQLLNELREESMQIKKKLDENTAKSKANIEDFNEEIDMLTHQLEVITNQSNDNIRTLESQLQKLNQQLQASKEESAELQEAIFIERQNTQSMSTTISKLRSQIDDYKKKSEQLQRIYEELVQQNREKDEHMYEMGGKLYEYQNRMKEMEEEKLREIEELNNNLNVRYDEDYQEIYQKIDFIQKEKDYFKEKYHEKEQEIIKKNEELRHKDIEELEIKKMYEDKIKKMEEEKLQIFTDKNKQITKVMEQNKAHFESIRNKQAQNRKSLHELQIARSTIQKLQSKLKQTQNERTAQVKSYQSEIENLRKKELFYKSYKDQVRSNQWNSERDVRKQIQNFIKKILELGEREVRNESVITLIKNLEEGLLMAIAAVSKEDK